MNHSDFLKYMMDREQMLRKTIPNPNEATLNIWRIQDQRRNAVIRIWEQREQQQAEDEAPTGEIKIRSEVIVK